jgi:hypothetical protein
MMQAYANHYGGGFSVLKSYQKTLACAPLEVIAVHAKLIARFGGIFGIRDRGALESALARPQSGYYTDLIQRSRCALGKPVPEAENFRLETVRNGRVRSESARLANRGRWRENL